MAIQIPATEQIEGTIENVVYYNEGNDYAVIEIVDKDELLITAVGIIPIPAEGERVVLTGKWVFHKEFGRQFSFENVEKMLPEGTEDIYKYLSSQIVKGVGPKTARKIVDRFGTDTFDVIENHPEWLVDISGITMKKAATISASFREQNGIRNVVMFCREHNMDVSDAARVYKQLGPGAVGVILENPYILCEGDSAVSFKMADEIAKSIGFNMKSDFRIISGIQSELEITAWNSGHTCVPFKELVSSAMRTLSLDEDFISAKISEYLSDAKISRYSSDGENYIALNEMDSAEDYIARRILQMDYSAIRYSMNDAVSMINKIEVFSGITYAVMQKKAIYEALAGGVMILTGGPGTGKTTVVKALLSIFGSMGLKTVLAAPTGRAAKRMSEATGEEAKTIHRMLEMERNGQSGIVFGRNEGNPLLENVVIVDEASMIDTLLMEALMRAMRRGSRLILIGDSNQLPSVGAGNVLSDLIGSERVRTVELNEIFRQAGDSLIVTNAHKINRGEIPDLTSTTGDFFFVRRDYEADIPNTIADLVTKRLPQRYGQGISAGIQIITPSRQGAGGINVLNTTLQERLNPKSRLKAEKSAHGVIFREGDRVMQIVNNYELEWKRGNESGMGVFNGDIGIIKKIDNPEMNMTVVYDDREVIYGYDMLSDLELAYAITVHKSQGSEYPVVIMPVYSCPPMLMTRNLLYTAITRAKQMVVMVGRADIAYKMVENNREVHRYTTLKDRIIAYS